MTEKIKFPIMSPIRFMFILLAVTILLIVIIAMARAETVADGYRTRWTVGSRDAAVSKYVIISEVDGDVNDFLVEVPQLANTVADRIVIDANGTDTAFEVTLWDVTSDVNDANGVAVFTKTDLTTVSVPYNYALVLSDKDSAETRGISLGYPVYLELEAAENATLDRVQITIYYRQEWQ